MNTIQTAASSERFNRLMLGVGALVLVAGLIVLGSRLVGGSDNTSAAPAQGFKPALPAKSTPLKNADGQTIKTFGQLDPEVRATIRTFLGTAVRRENLGQSWNVIAPSVKQGYTYKQWKNAKALPIIPYPIANLDKVGYSLNYATTKEILVDLGLTAKPEAKLRPTRFRLGLIPFGNGAQKRWVVDYWMPLWTPLVPKN